MKPSVSWRVSALTSTRTEVRSQRTLAILCFVAVFAAVGAGAPYLPLYYQSLGMSLEQIGLLAAAVALSALVAAPVWGSVSDALAGSRYVLPAAALLTAAFGAAMAATSNVVIVALLAVSFWLAFAGVGPLLDARALDTVAEDKNRYGRIRAWGSAAFVVSSIFVGSFIENTQLRALFIVLVPSIAVAGLLALGLRSQRSHEPRPNRSAIRSVLANRTLLWFLAAALIAWAANSAINAFLSIYLTSIGAPGGLVGLSWALGAVVEVPLLLAFPLLARRVGLERLVLIGAGLLFLRALAIAVVSDPVLAALTMALHGGGFALLLVGGVTYVARHAPVGASATAQGVLSGVIVGLAQIIGPGFGGLVARQFGLTSLFFAAAVAGAIGVAGLALAFGLRPGAARTPADSASELG